MFYCTTSFRQVLGLEYAALIVLVLLNVVAHVATFVLACVEVHRRRGVVLRWKGEGINDIGIDCYCRMNLLMAMSIIQA